jgi:outer membrane receptor protein involved in Fe transport
VLTSADIKAQGATRVEDIINTLPQAFAAQGSTISNGSTGGATVNLRGLGCSRTLVLVDGRRLMPGEPGSSCADLNFIPGTLVDRVDVETGGASAVYGADAVAGVVNFVMKKDFSGLALDAQYNTYQHDNGNSIGTIVKNRGFALPKNSITDGRGYEISAMLGANAPDGKGNVTAYATYRQINAILQSERDFSSCTLSESGQTTFSCGGSSTTYPGRFGTAAGSKTIDPATGNFRAYNSGTDAYNFGPLNYFQRPDERYTLGAFGHYQINKAAEAYTQLMFADDHSVGQIAPGGIFYGPQAVNCDNPLLNASELAAICGANAGTATNVTLNIGRRNVEGGGRQSDFRHTSYRIVAGLKGELNSTWSYDGYLQYGTTILQTQALNYFLNSRIARALIVHNVNGVPTCQSVIDGSDPSCVPYNMWKIGGVTPAALNYLQAPSLARGTTTERVAHLDFVGKLGDYGIKSPWAKDGVAVNLGTEYREESSQYRADFLASSGDLSGAGGASPPTAGHYNVYELFGEARVPLVSDMPFVKSLSVEGAYRYSDYSSVGTTDTFKLGVDWSVNDSVRLRSSFNRSVRAPNVNELYNPQNVQLDGTTDPCAGAAVGGLVNGYTAAQCARTGVSAAQFGLIDPNSATQYNGLTGGNPKLNPETSDTFSIGGVFTPTFVKGLSITVDYFDIKVSDFIGGVGADLAITNCVQNGTFCNLIHRDSAGSLWITPQGYIVDTNLNTGSVQTKGIDFSLNYRFNLDDVGLKDMGRVAISGVGTYLDSYVTEPLPGFPKYDCAGFYGSKCGTPNAAWRHKIRATWTTPWLNGLAVSGQWRYFDAVKLESTSSNAQLAGPVFAQESPLKAQNYIDLSATLKIKDNYTLRLGVNNVFDKDPPVVGATYCPAGQCNGNTFPQVYDALGRYFFAQISAQY